MASCAGLNPLPEASSFRRKPEEVMRLARLGSFHPTRISFMQTLLRRLDREGWRFARDLWQVDAKGVGYATYRVVGPECSYTLVAFAHDLPDDQRSDRVIATAWDATFTLFDGVPSKSDIERLSQNVPKQEAGRISDSELSLSRANRSVRLFKHVLERLARGEQPDRAQLESVGYLMRTTAVYGSGKFGAADRRKIAGRPELRGPFQAEMLAVWLIRTFTIDLVEHLARARGGERAVTMEPELRRLLGVGNSTGLGMAPFLMNHPVLLNNWMLAHEEALARVRAQESTTPDRVAAFCGALKSTQENARTWTSDHPIQQSKLAALRADLDSLDGQIDEAVLLRERYPWNHLWLWAERALSLEGQEALVSLLIEPHGDLVDGLSACMDADEDAAFRIDGSMPNSELRAILERVFGWALSTDFSRAENDARFWYISEEKLEPRLGERHREPGAELEQPLSTGRDVQRLGRDLELWQGEPRVADFLLAHPEHRHAVRRAQIAARYPFSEVRDNLISSDLLPIDLLRCKLSFFGATRFDPRSDRWVRICMYRTAPYPQELLDPAP